MLRLIFLTIFLGLTIRKLILEIFNDNLEATFASRELALLLQIRVKAHFLVELHILILVRKNF